MINSRLVNYSRAAVVPQTRIQSQGHIIHKPPLSHASMIDLNLIENTFRR
jgi:hypothetical protein